MDDQAYVDMYKIIDRRSRSGVVPLPNLLGVGAGRSGTTTLYKKLRAHPAISVSAVKEMNFFGLLGRRGGAAAMDIREYSNFFDHGAQVRCEVTPAYLTFPEALRHMVEVGLNAKIIIQLRDPIERFYSQYRHHQDWHKISEFEEYVISALGEWSGPTDWFRSGDWYAPSKNLAQSKFASHVHRYRDMFDDVLVLSYVELCESPGTYFTKVWNFIGVESLETEIPRENASTSMPGEFESLNRTLSSQLHDLFQDEFALLGELPENS